MEIEYKKESEGKYIINNGRLGELIRLEDGYFEWFPPNCACGYWSTWLLRNICDKVDEINNDWDEEIKNLK